jgi:hypothetical protein
MTICQEIVMTFLFPRSAVVTRITGPGSRSMKALAKGSVFI